MRTTVSDVMTTTIVSVPPTMSVRDVAVTLYSGAVRAVPVISADGTLLGVISEADLLPAVAATEDTPRRWWRPRHVHRGVPAPRPGAHTAEDLMSPAPVTIGPDATAASAARMMRERGVNWLPVVADRKLVGVLGRSDLLAVFFRPDDAIGHDVTEAVAAARAGTVAVKVDDGVVTLTGALPDRAAAEAAVSRARHVEGVIDVVDRLTWAATEPVPQRPTF